MTIETWWPGLPHELCSDCCSDYYGDYYSKYCSEYYSGYYTGCYGDCYSDYYSDYYSVPKQMLLFSYSRSFVMVLVLDLHFAHAMDCTEFSVIRSRVGPRKHDDVIC